MEENTIEYSQRKETTEQNWRTSKLEHEYEEETKNENRKLMEMEE